MIGGAFDELSGDVLRASVMRRASLLGLTRPPHVGRNRLRTGLQYGSAGYVFCIKRCKLGLVQGGKLFTNEAGLGWHESRQLFLGRLRVDLSHSAEELH